MTDRERVLERLRSANPLPGVDHVDADELGLFVSYFEERRDRMADTRTTRRHEPNETQHRWVRPVLVFVTALAVCLIVVGAAALLTRGEESSVEPAALTTVPPATTTPTTVPLVATSPTTDATTVSTTATPSPIVPALGEGWDIVISAAPNDPDAPSGLWPSGLFITDAGYYVGSLLPTDYYLMRLEGSEPTLVDVEVPGPGEDQGSGFVTGGPGVIAWATVGPESQTEAQLWVSSDGIDFERVAADLFSGCDGSLDCLGSQIYAAAASPAGSVVALGYDPLVWNAECECYELNPIAVVSDNGYEWTRQPLDLRSVLPAEWQGEADIRSPLVHVDGRWLTYATHYRNDCMCTDTAFFASENGLDWQLIDTGDLFDETLLHGMAANDRGVVALAPEAAYWSPDGIEWTRAALSDAEWTNQVAAYDDGYVVASSPRSPDGAGLSAIWYSADGTHWSRTPLELEDPTHWNTLVGDGPYLVAAGVTDTNLRAVWRWSE